MFLIIIIALIIALIAIIYGTIKMIFSKKKWVKIIAFTLSFALIFLFFSIYKAFYPSDEFYIEEWNYSTDITFPKSANIIWKDATYPDQHGDYTSSAIIELSPKDFINLRNSINTSKVLSPDSTYQGYKGIFTQYIPKKFQESIKFKDFYISTLKASFKIGFSEDNKTVIFQRHSS
jgi:hypothetical protein